MGYRSDWRIVFNTRNKAQVVWDTLHDYVVNNDQQDPVVSLLSEIMDDADYQNQDANLLEYSGDFWKMHAWDELIHELECMFEHDPEIDFAAIRLGEDHNDNEIRYGSHTRIYMVRSIGDADMADVPEAATKPIAQEAPEPAKCRCSINDIMLRGHDADCPERSQFA